MGLALKFPNPNYMLCLNDDKDTWPHVLSLCNHKFLKGLKIARSRRHWPTTRPPTQIICMHETPHAHKCSHQRRPPQENTMPPWVPWVDSPYHVQTNMSVRRTIVGGTSVHSILKGEVLFFSSVYVEKAIINLGVKVDVQKGALRFREKFDKRWVSFIQFMFSSIVVINDYHACSS